MIELLCFACKEPAASRESMVSFPIQCSVRYVHGPDPALSDIEAMVELHQAAFPGFFLTSLGPRFLRLLYRGFIDLDEGICIVAQGDQGLLGFAAGAARPGAFFRRLLWRRGMPFALATVPPLLRNPRWVFRRCFDALFYRGEEPEALPGAGLIASLAVLPEASGRGIGQQLIAAFCAELRRCGVESVYLITDAVDNERVNAFYGKCGFRMIDTYERPGNRRMNQWAKSV